MFQPSIFQAAIYDWAASGTGNLLVEAVAGSGKTTTLIEVMKQINPMQDIYYCAFAKANVDDIQSKVSGLDNVKVSTFHSIGNSILRKYRGSEMDQRRVYNVVNKLRNTWMNENELVDTEYLARVRRLVDLYRLELCSSYAEAKLLAEKHGVEVLDGEIEKCIEVVNILNADLTTHDFVDMLYIPATNPSMKAPQPHWVLVDECQDLNKAQQALLAKMLGEDTRFIAVGDPHQAIYGFAGADADSFARFQSFPNTTMLPLSFNYRCAKAVIDLVHEMVPGLPIIAHEGAPEGEVVQNDSLRNIKDGDMVLCRSTAPLVRMCLEFIKDQKKAFVKGGDMGKQLINVVVSSKADTIDEFELYLNKELSTIYNRIQRANPGMTSNEVKEESTYRLFADKKEVFETIIDTGNIQNPDSLINWISRIFADDKAGVTFSTIHRAKGLENERVFIIERSQMPSPWAKKDWQKIQEVNLIYVALTRAKMRLGFITDWSYKRNRR